MKKTNDKKPKNFFLTKKFQEDLYEKDKISVLEKYNELGYRDAIIVRDTVIKNENDNTVKVELWIEEGNKYHIRNFKWVGNTIYPSPLLENYLGIRKGEVYNQKRLQKRLSTDNDALSNLYLDKGYLFSSIIP
jgi:outer membrane protein insertion porin family